MKGGGRRGGEGRKEGRRGEEKSGGRGEKERRGEGGGGGESVSVVYLPDWRVCSHQFHSHSHCSQHTLEPRQLEAGFWRLY